MLSLSIIKDENNSLLISQQHLDKYVNQYTQKERFTLLKTESSITHFAKQFIANQSKELENIQADLQEKVKEELAYQAYDLSEAKKKISLILQLKLVDENHFIDLQTQKIKWLQPINILKRGYSLSFDSKRNIIKTMKDVPVGAEITTQFMDGELTSIVKSTKFVDNESS